MSSADMKIKIFIFAIFILLGIVFVTEIASFLNGGFSSISENKKQIDCSRVDITVIEYRNNNLILEISSVNMNISIINIVDANNTRSFQIPMVRAGESGSVTIPNITLSEDYQVYPEDCKDEI